MLLKASAYNLEVQEKEDGTIYLYNTLSGQGCFLSRQQRQLLLKQKGFEASQETSELVEKGLAVPFACNETEKLKERVHSYTERLDRIQLSIIVTRGCNYRCIYCFEKDALCEETMSEQTADEVVSFVKRLYQKYDIHKPLLVKWFGGEPLLNLHIIGYLSSKLRKNGIKISGSMFTNGRLLTEETALQLKELGVDREVVISLDGLAESYAKIKGCSEDDFYQVVSNIAACQDILKLQIHLKYSEANKQEMGMLKAMLRFMGIHVPVFMEPVMPFGSAETTEFNSYQNDSCAGHVSEFQGSMKYGRPYLCEAPCSNYFAIGAGGETYLCKHLIGKEEYRSEHVSKLSGPLSRMSTIWDPDAMIDACADCVLVPICNGRCPTGRLIDGIPCEKESLIEALKTYVRSVISKESEQNICEPSDRVAGTERFDGMDASTYF